MPPASDMVGQVDSRGGSITHSWHEKNPPAAPGGRMEIMISERIGQLLYSSYIARRTHLLGSLSFGATMMVTAAEPGVDW